MLLLSSVSYSRTKDAVTKQEQGPGVLRCLYPVAAVQLQPFDAAPVVAPVLLVDGCQALDDLAGMAKGIEVAEIIADIAAEVARSAVELFDMREHVGRPAASERSTLQPGNLSEASVVEQKLALAYSEEVTDPAHVAARRYRLAAEILVELLAVDLDASADGRDRGVIAAKESEIFAEWVAGHSC